VHVDGVFGMARTTGTPSERRLSMRAGRDRRRDGEDRLLREDERADLAEQALDVLCFTATTTSAAPAAASWLESVASMP
jgi:hypothetical protein